MATVPQSEIDYQMANKNAYSGSGLGAFMIVGFIVTNMVVALRVVSRVRYMKLQLAADDWAIIAAQVGQTLRDLGGGYY